MKKYICKSCIVYDGKEPCVLVCQNDLAPTHCPHDDSKYPNSYWEPVPQQGKLKCPNCVTGYYECAAMACSTCGHECR